jgi:hypothetical protein
LAQSLPHINRTSTLKVQLLKNITMKKLVLFTAFVLSVSLSMAQYGNNAYQGQQPHQGGNMGYNSGAANGPPVMNAQEFQRAQRAISQQSFERDRLQTANSIARNSLMRSEQVRRIATLFSFESSRLDFAKAAYTRVIDPQNYYLVNSAFRFSSSAHDLERYTSTQIAYQAPIYGSGNPVGSCAPPQTGMIQGQHGSTTYSGNVTVTSSHGGMGINHGAAPAPMPACGACQGHHAMDHICPMSFGRLLGAIEKQCFDDDKLLIARQGLRGQLISTDQVLQIMNLLTFDRHKLDFAKFAYTQTWNSHEYYLVNDGFTFSSSIRDLDRYIRSVG